MNKIKCGTSRCSNVISHYHAFEECYYCEHCVLVLCGKDECEPLGNVAAIHILTNFCQDILDDIKDYASSQQPDVKWRLALDQQKQFEADLANIKNDLKSAIDDARPKDLLQIQRRASDLRTQIASSEAFSKYLAHKEMTRLRFRDADRDNEMLLRKTARIISEAKTEEEKIMIRNRFERVKHLLAPEPVVNKVLEDFKLKHDAEIEDIKKTHTEELGKVEKKHSEDLDELKNKFREDKEKSNKEKDDLLNQRIEIEQELKKIKDQYTEFKDGPQCISYEV